MAARGNAAAAQGAWIVFEDESGQSLRPPKARSWGRRGRTPVVAVPGGRGKGKVTTAALACYRPGHRSRLLYRQHVWRRRKGEAKSFSWRGYRDLLIAAHHQLPGGKIVLIWDNLSVHLDIRMRKFIAEVDWLSVVQLPAYAPELNPVEGIWSVIKGTVLANLAATGLDHVITTIRHGLKRLQYRPEVIDGCLAATGLTTSAINH
jgi:transposase